MGRINTLSHGGEEKEKEKEKKKAYSVGFTYLKEKGTFV